MIGTKPDNKVFKIRDAHHLPVSNMMPGSNQQPSYGMKAATTAVAKMYGILGAITVLLAVLTHAA